MQKQVFVAHVAESLGIPPNLADLSKALGVSYQAVRQWPDPITIRVAQFVIGDFVRINKRVPAEVVKFVRGKK